jgi:hypothetical protein
MADCPRFQSWVRLLLPMGAAQDLDREIARRRKDLAERLPGMSRSRETPRRGRLKMQASALLRAGAVAPIRLVDGRQIVVVSAPYRALSMSIPGASPSVDCACALASIAIARTRTSAAAIAPASDWIINFSPFMNGAERSSALSRDTRGSLYDSYYERLKTGHARDQYEARVLADEAQNARCIVSDGSERFRTPCRFETDPTTDFVR